MSEISDPRILFYDRRWGMSRGTVSRGVGGKDINHILLGYETVVLRNEGREKRTHFEDTRRKTCSTYNSPESKSTASLRE